MKWKNKPRGNDERETASAAERNVPLAASRIMRNKDYAAAWRRVNQDLRERRKTAGNTVRRTFRKNGAWAI